MSEIKSAALTAEEWAATHPLTNYENESERADQIEESVNGLERPMFQKAAALALSGQPFGFSHEDVSALRQVAEDRDRHLRGVLNNLADRIESLLPPGKP